MADSLAHGSGGDKTGPSIAMSAAEVQTGAEAFFDLAPSAIFTVDLEGKITSWNKQAAAITGYSEPEILGQRCTVFAANPCTRQCGLFSDRLPKPFFGGRCTILTKGGELRTISKNIDLLRDHRGEVIGGIECFEDVEERKRAEEALRDSERTYRTLIEAIDDAISIKDVYGRYILANSALARRMGRTREDILGKTDASLYPPEVAGNIWELDRRVLETGIPQETEEQYELSDLRRFRLVRKVPLRSEAGDVTGIVTVSRDITERKQQEMQLSYLASHDPLTGLPNRRNMEHALALAVEAASDGEPSCLMFLDLDDFKLVNDTLGHEAGDDLLLELSTLLHRTIRSCDLLARLGGDEFAILLRGASMDQAHAIAERCRLAVGVFKFSHETHDFALGASIGIVPLDGVLEPSQILSMADTVMYQAKEQGKNRVCVCQPDDGQLKRLSDSSRTVLRLKQAIRDDLLILHYQPVVRLRDGHIEHYEALVRLKGENGEIIPPGEFLPVAERFGMVGDLTRWVISRVIAVLGSASDIRIFVNLSARSVGDEDLLDFIASALAKTGLDPDLLGFEITEAGLTRDLVAADGWIRRLRGLGCRIALGRFGTGYSSLSHLRSLPVDQVKIDGWLIKALEKDPLHKALVQAIQTMARAVGKEVVAEYVENEAVAAILRETNVDLGQGFHLGRPGPDLRSS